jgi:peptidoglycan/LPS O-acetylase OafA/YrhL
MPRMDGLELIGRLRKHTPGLPIVLISGYVDTLGMNEASTGADVVIQKSANEVSHLIRSVNRLLRTRTAQWFGALSYPIYLVNEPIHKVIAPVLSRFTGNNPVLFSALWIPAAIVLPVLAAAWLHTYVEAPAMRLRRRTLGVAGQYSALTAANTGRTEPILGAGSPERGVPTRALPEGNDQAAVTVQRDGRGL